MKPQELEAAVQQHLDAIRNLIEHQWRLAGVPPVRAVRDELEAASRKIMDLVEDL